jgi:hypothetical protein
MTIQEQEIKIFVRWDHQQSGSLNFQIAVKLSRKIFCFQQKLFKFVSAQYSTV